MFNLFTPPCFAAIGAMRSEMKSGKWMLGGVSLQLATGFTVAYLVYTIGTLLTDASLLNINYALAGLVAVLVFAFVIGVLCVRGDRKVQKSKINKKEKVAVK
jgi:ferrous iron transport protein B